MGKLIVMEGIDGSGKTTQVKLLCGALERDGIPFRMLDYPRYGKPSCAPVEQYLHGAYGKKPGDVNAYAASSFFAVDRVASYLEEWREYYEAGGLLIANRYTTSNVLHQGAKLPEGEREKFIRWLYDFEFGLLELPKPELVLYMDVSLHTAVGQMRRREAEKHTTADIHETDNAYLADCRDCGLLAVKLLGWTPVPCEKNGVMRTPEEIHHDILTLVKSRL